MPRRSGTTSVCAATFLCPLLALLIAGCGRPAADRIPLAKHGVGRLVYKQLHAVARAAESVALEAAEADEADEADEDDDTGEPTPMPAARTDVPPDSWVAAFPAPDVSPMPLASASASAEPLPAEDAPAQAVVPPPEPVAALEQPAPSIAAEPAPEVLPEPQVVVFVPGGGDGSPVAAATPQLPAMPALDGTVVNLLVIAPILAIPALPAPRASAKRPVAGAHRHAPAHPQVGARPLLPPGARVGLPANVRRR